MSNMQAEILFNSICFGMALSIGGFTLLLFRAFQPRFYGLLFWALYLSCGAAVTYLLYGTLLDALAKMTSTDLGIVGTKTRLTENIKLLSFIVPGLMLGVAANLLTAFLQASKPSNAGQAR